MPSTPNLRVNATPPNTRMTPSRIRPASHDSKGQEKAPTARVRLLVTALALASIQLAALGSVNSAPAQGSSLEPVPQATPSGPLTSLSGFVTVAAGKVLGGSQDTSVNQGYDCPCFISDYAQNGVYESKGLQLRPDTKLGLQGRVASQDQRYALTAQLVSRGAANGKTNLEWLYASAEMNSRLTVQLGRKRLPLFQYSDVQDVGHAIPWVHLPPQMYGWEIVNYNGASIGYRDSVGAWAISANGFMGGETANDAGYWKIYNGKATQTRARWSNIIGAEVKASRDWFEIRAMAMQSNTQNQKIGIDATFSRATKQRIVGLSLQADFGGPFAAAEFLAINRDEDYGGDRAQLVSLGYRAGKFTPFVSFTNYQQRLNNPAAIAEAHSSLSAVLRYDLNSTSALKIQYDRWTDRTNPGFGSMHGQARVLTVSYDKVF
jgi:hypothetical protein